MSFGVAGQLVSIDTQILWDIVIALGLPPTVPVLEIECETLMLKGTHN